MKSMRHRYTFLVAAVLTMAVSFAATAAPMTEPDLTTMRVVNQTDQVAEHATEQASLARGYGIAVRDTVGAIYLHQPDSNADAAYPSLPAATVVAGLELVATGRLPLPDNPRLFPPTPSIGLS